MAEDGLIEVAFKAQKSYLGLKNECQAHDFDTCNAFMVISSIRLQLMEFNRRLDNAPCSIGEFSTVPILNLLMLPLLKLFRLCFL